jgi:hypothetical protein
VSATPGNPNGRPLFGVNLLNDLPLTPREVPLSTPGQTSQPASLSPKDQAWYNTAPAHTTVNANFRSFDLLPDIIGEQRLTSGSHPFCAPHPCPVWCVLGYVASGRILWACTWSSFLFSQTVGILAGIKFFLPYEFSHFVLSKKGSGSLLVQAFYRLFVFQSTSLSFTQMVTVSSY